MSEIRRITITGGAHILSGTSEDTTSTRGFTRRRVKGGAAMTQPIMKVVVEEKVNVSPQIGGVVAATTATATQPQTKTIQITQTVEPQQVHPPATQLEGSVGKVVLGGKKPKNLKVLLTKKNHDSIPAATGSTSQQSTHLIKNRKVTLGLQHLKRRVTKARRLQKFSKTIPIEQIRKELIVAKIIKEDSKAPETILRQMYSDAKLVSTKSL